jgi:aspartate/methionine/tyrosine aminotransferase
MVICASVPVQRAVTAALEHDPDYPTRWVGELRQRRDFLVDALASMPGVTPVKPAGGFFVMARLEGVSDSKRAALALIDQQHVVTIPGVFFGRAGEGYLRLSYGAATRERLATACARIAEFLAAARIS